MIRRIILLNINKKYWGSPGTKGLGTALFHKFPTFSDHFGRKNIPPCGNVTRPDHPGSGCYANRIHRVFHRHTPLLRTSKYLLKTHSFPHSPQGFPQGFSTAFPGLWKGRKIDIKRSDTLRHNPHFFAGRVFYHRTFPAQKFSLDKPLGATAFYPFFFLPVLAAPLEQGQKFLKKGVDFVAQRRYNVYPYGKLTKEEV